MQVNYRTTRAAQGTSALKSLCTVSLRGVKWGRGCCFPCTQFMKGKNSPCMHSNFCCSRAPKVGRVMVLVGRANETFMRLANALATAPPLMLHGIDFSAEHCTMAQSELTWAAQTLQ